MRETITAALKHATKAQDKRRMSTLRLVSAAIKDRDIAARTAGKGEATDAELLDLFAKMIKQREEFREDLCRRGPRRARQAGGRGDRHHPRVPPRTALGSRRAQGRRRCYRASGRGERQGHGQGDGGTQSELCRPDGLRQGERAGEAEARLNTGFRRYDGLVVLALAKPPSAAIGNPNRLFGFGPRPFVLHCNIVLSLRGDIQCAVQHEAIRA